MKNKLKTNIVEVLNNLTSFELITLMVKSLRNPKTKIDMKTFGYYNGDYCFGCAATNTILYLYKVRNPSKYLSNKFEGTSSFLGKNEIESRIIRILEVAIDRLRQGYLDDYNYHIMSLSLYGIHIQNLLIENPTFAVPILTSNFKEEDLKRYEKLAKLEKSDKCKD